MQEEKDTSNKVTLKAGIKVHNTLLPCKIIVHANHLTQLFNAENDIVLNVVISAKEQTRKHKITQKNQQSMVSEELLLNLQNKKNIVLMGDKKQLQTKLMHIKNSDDSAIFLLSEQEIDHILDDLQNC